jgi:hypothetical protein
VAEDVGDTVNKLIELVKATVLEEETTELVLEVVGSIAIEDEAGSAMLVLDVVRMASVLDELKEDVIASAWRLVLELDEDEEVPGGEIR